MLALLNLLFIEQCPDSLFVQLPNNAPTDEDIGGAYILTDFTSQCTGAPSVFTYVKFEGTLLYNLTLCAEPSPLFDQYIIKVVSEKSTVLLGNIPLSTPPCFVTGAELFYDCNIGVSCFTSNIYPGVNISVPSSPPSPPPVESILSADDLVKILLPILLTFLFTICCSIWCRRYNGRQKSEKLLNKAKGNIREGRSDNAKLVVNIANATGAPQRIFKEDL